MAGIREKAKDIRKSLLRFFCLCTAATPTADDGEVPAQHEGRLRFVVRSDLDQAIDVPAQSEMSNGKVLGLTHDFSRLFERREPRQQLNVERKAALTSILEQATPSVFVPHHQVPSSASRPRQQPPSVSEPLQQSTPSVSVPRQLSPNGDRKTEIASILEQVTGGLPSASIQVRSMSEFIDRRLSFTCSDIPVFQPSQPTAAISMPCQQAPPAISMTRQNVDRKTEIASILEQVTGVPSSASIQEVREMYEFIERALSFMRSDLPVFQPSQASTAPRPIFAQHGAVFTPGALFEPRATFTHGAGFEPGDALPSRRVVA